jgi:ectoine hydroxylase-related dioxygenase (phytanoyl-CoA dioxygenase family)
MLSSLQISEFHRKGFILLQKIVPNNILEAMRAECDILLGKVDQNDVVENFGCILEPLGQQLNPDLKTFHPTSQDEYKSTRSSRLRDEVTQFICSKLVVDMVSSIIGPNVFLFNEQYIVKPPNSEDGSIFNYHQDGEYLEDVNIPFVSCWICLDDTTPENGALHMVPYFDTADSKSYAYLYREDYIRHHRGAADKYPPKYTLVQKHLKQDPSLHEIEVAMYIPAGSIIIIASQMLHRSTGNKSNDYRRAFMPQFSSRAITSENSKQPLVFAVPLL